MILFEKKLLKMILKFVCENTGMEMPDSKPKYEKLNENIEKWTGIYFLLAVQVTTPALLMPNFIKSFYLYFATDLESEAFSLPFPIWCVFHFFVTTEN